MKKFIIHYRPITGLKQTTPLDAYKLCLKDGFFHFYRDETSFNTGDYFKLINKDSVDVIEEQ